MRERERERDGGWKREHCLPDLCSATDATLLSSATGRQTERKAFREKLFRKTGSQRDRQTERCFQNDRQSERQAVRDTGS